MTSKLTREELLNIIETDHVQCGEASALARMALAAMDSEPVVYASEETLAYAANGELLLRVLSQPAGDAIIPLYRHAQPALTPYAWSYDWACCVTCEGPQDFEPVIEREPPPQWAIDEGRVKNLITLYRTAQPAPVVPDEMLCEFYEVDSWPDLVRELVKHVEQLQDSAKRNVKPWEDTFPETLLPAYIERIKQADEACRAAMLQAGNSPVIAGPDRTAEVRYVAPPGYVMVPIDATRAMIDAAMRAEEDGYDAMHKAMLAAAPQEVPDGQR